jgi:lipid A 3-O-deacylase
MIRTMRHPCSKPPPSCPICRTIKLLVFVCTLLWGEAFAQQLDNKLPVEGFSVHLGQNGDLQRVAAVYETPVWWRYLLGHNGARVDLNGEFEISYWMSGDREPSHLWQLGFTPMFRWWPRDTFYVEAGVGATVVNQTRFAGRDLSTAFQFGSHLGMGVLINRRHKIALRISHFSNADIKTPNPGLNLIELTYTYQF